MVFGGARPKSIIKKNSRETLPRAMSKMAPPPSPHTSSSRAAKQRQKQQPQDYIEYTASSQTAVMDTLHPNIIKQFEKMLQKALKQTSKHITESLTKEIRELGQRTSDLSRRCGNKCTVPCL